MLDITFSESAYGLFLDTRIEDAFERINPALCKSHKIFSFEFELGYGKLSDGLFSDSRRALLEEMFSCGDYPAKDEVEERFSRMEKTMNIITDLTTDGESITFWVDRTASSRCGLYYLCNLLKDYPADMYYAEVPTVDDDSGMWNMPLTDWAQNLHCSIEDFKVQSSNFKEFKGITKLKPESIRTFASLWDKLLLEDAPLRVLMNNTVVSVGEDFLDSWILNSVTETPIVERIVIGKACERCSGMDAGWYHKRITHFIKNGEFELVSGYTDEVYSCKLRKKSMINDQTFNM